MADGSERKGTVGTYPSCKIEEKKFSVLDSSGNELAKDQIRLIAEGREVITTVDTIKDMDQMQIFDFIRSRSR